jgi:hypothetical protein
MQISDYFASLERGIHDDPNVTTIEVLASEASDDYNGLLKARIQFWNEQVAPSEQPSLSQVLAEVADKLAQ